MISHHFEHWFLVPRCCCCFSISMQDRIKSGLLWLWLFKSLQPCLSSSRRSSSLDDGGALSATYRLGRLPLSGESLAMWRSTTTNGGIFGVQKQQQQRSRKIVFGKYHGMDLQNRPILEDSMVTKPVSLKGTWRRRGEVMDDELTSESTTSTVTTEPPTISKKEHAIQLTRPLIPQDAFDATTGLEFSDPAMVEALVQSGLEMCTSQGDESSFVEWFSHPNTDKVLEEHSNSPMLAMEEGHVLVYVGKSKQQQGIVGSHLPIIKTQSILPLSAKEMAEVLMDSSKVKIYNKMSLGRKDVKIFNAKTKIVRNLTQPPMASSKMVSVTLMHSRALTNKDQMPTIGSSTTTTTSGYIVVSRAVPGMVDEDLKDLTRNDILLGVNLLQDVGTNECLMTAVTHVYSPALPSMLAQSMGVSSAVNFVRDIRAAFGKETVAAN